jgi:hypothetical protein
VESHGVRFPEIVVPAAVVNSIIIFLFCCCEQDSHLSLSPEQHSPLLQHLPSSHSSPPRAPLLLSHLSSSHIPVTCDVGETDREEERACIYNPIQQVNQSLKNFLEKWDYSMMVI